MTDGVVLLTGPPCSGKSSVGRLLVTHSSSSDRVLIEVDSLFSLLLPGSDRNREDRMLAYDAAHLLARTIVERGRVPVLECTYSRHQQRTSLLDALADIPTVALWVVEFTVNADDAVQRFRSREQPTDLDELRVRARAEAFPYSTQARRVSSSTATPGDVAHEIATWLDHRPPSLDRRAWAEMGNGWD